MVLLKKCMLFLLGAMSLTGCATNIQLDVKHVPELDLGAVKTVKIENFDVQGHVDISSRRNDLLGFVGHLILDDKIYKPDSANLQKTFRTNLTEAIVQNGYFKVVDSDSADARIAGKLTYTVNDSLYESESTDSKGVKTKSCTLTRRGEVTITFFVYDKSGKLLGSSTVLANNYNYTTGDSEGEADRRATTVTDTVLNALTPTYAQLVKKIAPYNVTEMRTLRKGKTDVIVQGNKAAKDGKWSDAVLNWNDGLSDGKPEDHVAAIYNLAVYDEVTGKLDEALKKYEEAYSLTKAKDDFEAVVRTQMRIKEAEHLNQMEKSRNSPLP